jgi:hypothetical protein
LDAVAGRVIIDAIQAFSMVLPSSFCYALAMSAAVIPAPDRDTQIAVLTAALATAKAELAARDLLIETLRVQIARPSTARKGGRSGERCAGWRSPPQALPQITPPDPAQIVMAGVAPVSMGERLGWLADHSCLWRERHGLHGGDP